MNQLPFSQACENNKGPILQVLQNHLDGYSSVLEIGGGTGQHAVFFARCFPHLIWQSTDTPANVAILNMRLEQAGLPNLPLARPLDVNDRPWSCDSADVVFTANSMHIMSMQSVVNFVAQAGSHCHCGGKLMIYGPFKYGGEFTTESNARFDLALKQKDEQSGIRDFEWLNRLAREAGFDFIEDNPMPANNQLLVWKRIPSP